MKSRLRSLLTFFIGWPLSVIAIIFIVRLIMSHSQELQAHLADINYFLIAVGGICFFLYYFLRSYVYQKILNFLGYPLSLQETAYFWGQSEMHRYIPGNVWSFLGRTVLFSKKNVERKDIATSLIIESQLVLIGTLLVTLMGIPFLISVFLSHLPFSSYFTFFCVVAVFLGSLFYIFSHRTTQFIKFPLLKRLLATPFTTTENVTLIATSFISYLMFGLGYYFIFISLVPLPPDMLWQFVGFFAFSLLVGYISLLTPTGLGIREGILILGLSRYAPSAVVGFASILARILLIIAEVLYLLLSLVWMKIADPRVARLESYIGRHKHIILLSVASVLYAIYFTIASFLRYDNFYTGRFDLGNMAQTVWNTSQGRIFEFTNPNATETVSRLAFHADFILVLLAPFYFLWTDPKMLLLIQTIITASGAFFVYFIAQKVLKGRTLPLIIAIVFLLNPSLQRANLYDFHAVTLATTFLLGAFYFLLVKKDKWFLLFLLLAALTKEQVWLTVAFFGIYIAIFQKRRAFGVSLTVIGLGLFSFLIFHAIPKSFGSQHFALAYYSDFGDSPGDVLKNMILKPHQTLPILFEKDRLHYYQQIAGPVGFLAVFSPLYLLFAAGDIGINLLSSNPQLHQIYYQYTATITPFLFIAVIFGIKKLLQFFPDLPRWTVAVYLLAASLLSIYHFGPLPGAKEPNLDMFTRPVPHAAQIEEYLRGLPKSYSVSAGNNLGSHLSHREKIYTIPQGVEEADIVALMPDTSTSQSSLAQKEIISRLRVDPEYIIFYEIGDFIVFKKIQKLDTIER